MRARAHILLPYAFDIPEGAQFRVGTWGAENYKITFNLPMRVEESENSYNETEVTIDGVKTFKGRALSIDFHKEVFNRQKGGESDPPEEEIFKAANWLLQRIRTVTGSPFISPLGKWDTKWTLTYLNDDGSAPKDEADKIRGRGIHRMDMSYCALTPELWNHINDLPADYETPAWVTLLLDARKLLPEIGPPIVLAAAALETLIKNALGVLAARNNLPSGWWQWMNSRTPRERQPSLTEEYGILLKLLSGKSLEDDTDLWEGFQNIRSARNSFVHEGVARIGKKRQPITREEAGELVQYAERIALFVRGLLPSESQWPIYVCNMKIEVTGRPFRPRVGPTLEN